MVLLTEAVALQSVTPEPDVAISCYRKDNPEKDGAVLFLR